VPPLLPGYTREAGVLPSGAIRASDAPHPLNPVSLQPYIPWSGNGVNLPWRGVAGVVWLGQQSEPLDNGLIDAR
jgi:hypothetical protein